MNRSVLWGTVIGFSIGASVTNLIRNASDAKESKLASETVHVMTDVSKQYIDGYHKLNAYNNELVPLAKSYDQANSPDARVKISEDVIRKITDFNSGVSR